ncbi:SGT1 protein-domain-containing protein [Morchella snyderi]|nr:SGT1 protein-domain-containing protein [Morchella snyderi]
MESPDPFAPGFAPFQGIPQRTLPDDCVAYTLFAPALAPAPAAAAKTRLAAVKAQAEALAAQWSAGYIWQREGFALELVQQLPHGAGGAGEGVWCLQGRTEYGDAVDDEWFVVWMLRELSARFADVWTRVYDTDGEFLLIEAASALPRWLNPEIADHRVWINSTHLHIIPLSAGPPAPASPTAPVSRPLTLADALAILHTHSTTAPTLTRIRLVEEEAFYRTTRYPAAAALNAHHALATIPRPLAHLLHTHPAAVAAAVEAFYLRDPISLKALTHMTHFRPAVDDVTVSVQFTKTLYAQLKGQDFSPPPSAAFPPHPADAAAADVGMKLTCGFEMLLSDACAPQLTSPSRQRTVATIRSHLPPATLPTDGEIAAWPRRVDGEEWLDVDYAEFEHTLQGRPGHKGTQNESGWGDKGAEENLRRMVERFEAFLNDDGAGVEGAVVGDDDDADEMDDDDDDEEEEELNSADDDDDDEGEDREVSFDEREFERMMREMMGMPQQERGDDNSNGDGDGDEEADIRTVMRQVEAELRAAGALETALPKKQRISEVGASDDDGKEEEEEGADDAELNIDYALAANMLESFKGQGGLAGPGGNLLARMGIGLPPRDEGGRGGEGEGGDT